MANRRNLLLGYLKFDRYPKNPLQALNIGFCSFHRKPYDYESIHFAISPKSKLFINDQDEDYDVDSVENCWKFHILIFSHWYIRIYRSDQFNQFLGNSSSIISKFTLKSTSSESGRFLTRVIFKYEEEIREGIKKRRFKDQSIKINIEWFSSV